MKKWSSYIMVVVLMLMDKRPGPRFINYLT